MPPVYQVNTVVTNGELYNESTVRTKLAASAGAVAVNSQKVTSLAAGTVATDAVNLGQLDASVGLQPIDIYIDFATGNDANNGSLGFPVKTFTRAQELKAATWRQVARLHFGLGSYPIPLITTLSGGPEGGKAATEEWIGTAIDQFGVRTSTAGTTGANVFDSTIAASFRTSAVASITAAAGTGQVRLMTVTGLSGLTPADAGTNVTTLTAALGVTPTAGAAIEASTVGFNPNGGFVVIGTEICQYFSLTPTAFVGVTRGAQGSVIAAHLLGDTVSDGSGKNFLFALATNPGNNGFFQCCSYLSATSGVFFNAQSVIEASALIYWQDSWRGSALRFTNPSSLTCVAVAPVTGTGDSFTQVATVTTLTDAAGLFTSAMVGASVIIAGATSPANNGIFTIASFISPTAITYTNAAGVTEAYGGAWSIALLRNGDFFSVTPPPGSAGILQPVVARFEFKTSGAFVAVPGRTTIDVSALGDPSATGVAAAVATALTAAGIGVTGSSLAAVVTVTTVTGIPLLSENVAAAGFTTQSIAIQASQQISDHGIVARGALTVVPVVDLIDNDRFFLPDGTNPGANFIYIKTSSVTAPTFAGDVLTGALTFTAGLAAVTGVGTLFTLQVRAGDWIYLDADGTAAYRKVLSVTSDVALTLTAVYGGAGGSGASHVGRVIDISALSDTSAAGVGVATAARINAMHPVTLRVRADTNNTNLATISSTITAASNGLILPQPTINVVSTTNFAAAGTALVTTSLGIQTVTYTGILATSLTGCSGGLGTMTTGGVVTVSNVVQTAIVNVGYMLPNGAGIAITESVASAAFLVSGFTGGIGTPTTCFTIAHTGFSPAPAVGQTFVVEKPGTVFQSVTPAAGLFSFSLMKGNLTEVELKNIKWQSHGVTHILAQMRTFFDNVEFDLTYNGIMNAAFCVWAASPGAFFANDTSNVFAPRNNNSRWYVHNGFFNTNNSVLSGFLMTDHATVNANTDARLTPNAVNARRTVFTCAQLGVFNTSGSFFNGSLVSTDPAIISIDQGGMCGALGGNSVVSNSPGAGILIRNSSTFRIGAISGSNNARAGINVDRRSGVTIDIAPSTAITGNLGDSEFGHETIPNIRSYAALRTADGTGTKGFQDTHLNRVDA